VKRGEIVFWQGNEACAYGALAAGCKFFGGYPITPSTEIAEILSGELPKVGGKFIQMEDEIAAIAAALGASLAGRKSLTASSGPGISLKLENIGFGAMAEIPLVIINVMRGGPSTGLPTKASQSDVMQAKWGSHGDRPCIALVPNSIGECFYLTVQAFNLAEKYRLPVFVLLDEVLGHMREPFIVPEQKDIAIINRKDPSSYNLYSPNEYLPYKHVEDDVPAMAPFGGDYRFHVTGLFHDETGFPTNDAEEADKKMRRLMRKVDNNLDDIVEYEELETEDCEYLMVAYGSTSRAASSAVMDLRAAGKKVGLLRPKTVWPFPEKRLMELNKQVKKIVVAELNCGQVSLEVERFAGREKVRFLGRVDGELLTPDQMIETLEEVMSK
jgi:2-oxoglutarate ferredoxin oxidoreductase subunit alpha